MTLIVNKTATYTRFIVTQYESNAVTTGSTIELFNRATNVNYTYALPADSSAYPSRYQEYILPTTTFSALTEGVYSFNILDGSGNGTESGLLKVIPEIFTQQGKVNSRYIYIPTSATDDDFIVYQK